MEQIIIECGENAWWESLSDEEFQVTFRMNKQTFTELQVEIDNDENKDNPEIDKNLLACLWVLGNSSNFEEVGTLFDIEDINNCLDEYSKKILKLNKTYVTWPNETECVYIENSFSTLHEFPGVIGVIGTLYIDIKTDNLPKIYYNEEMRKHMIVLQIVCDSNLLIRDVAVGFPAGKTVKDILKSSPLYCKLTDPNGYLMQNKKHLLGGYKHPELKTLLTPYDLKGANEDKKKCNFNALHESVMTTVEKTFRCIEIRFPRITSMEVFEPKFASQLVGAICLLHNFCIVRNDVLE